MKEETQKSTAQKGRAFLHFVFFHAWHVALCAVRARFATKILVQKKAQGALRRAFLFFAKDANRSSFCDVVSARHKFISFKITKNMNVV